jgi:hypothetical protein
MIHYDKFIFQDEIAKVKKSGEGFLAKPATRGELSKVIKDVLSN